MSTSAYHRHVSSSLRRRFYGYRNAVRPHNLICYFVTMAHANVVNSWVAYIYKVVYGHIFRKRLAWINASTSYASNPGPDKPGHGDQLSFSVYHFYNITI